MRIMEKKYELTDNVINHNGRTLYRIRALRGFSDVKAGNLGGYIQTEDNLSHEGDAWVYDYAKVYDDACVFGNASISGIAEVYNNANVYNDAVVYDNAKVSGFAEVSGNACVNHNANVYDNAEVYGDAHVYGDAIVYEFANILGRAIIGEDAEIHGSAIVRDNAQVYDNAEVCGSAVVGGRAHIAGDAKVKNRADYIVFKNFWSSGRYFTWTRSNNKWKAGCFHGTGEELINKAYADSEKSGREYERVVRYVESILADEEKEDRV